MKYTKLYITLYFTLHKTACLQNLKAIDIKAKIDLIIYHFRFINFRILQSALYQPIQDHREFV